MELLMMIVKAIGKLGGFVMLIVGVCILVSVATFFHMIYMPDEVLKAINMVMALFGKEVFIVGFG